LGEQRKAGAGLVKRLYLDIDAFSSALFVKAIYGF
jgi:hypothetical protein